MKLDSIDILGFKSFANRVNLQFPIGITGIVGPNGCGKTNIIEAVRWVLGEQNIRTLRGERMEEVIFNGTAERKPLGMAEVRLSFSDPEHRMGLEADQFVVGRQIFRSGESNYSLNGKVCRLKDVQDLFMDTGMGSHAYSMIEQQMIDAVLSDKAEERRFLFEEAAGIQKYKLRRKFALRKLEGTEGDLTRIDDIVREVQRTVNSLGRQVGKARRFKNLSEKLRRVAVTLARDELLGIESDEGPMLSRLDELKNELASTSAAENTQAAAGEEVRTRINGCRLEAEEVAGRLERLNSEIRQAEDELTSIRVKRSAGREWIESSTRRLENLKESIARRLEELSAFEEQVRELRAGAARSEQEHSTAHAEAERKNTALSHARAEAAGAGRRHEELLEHAASCRIRAETLEDSASAQKAIAAELEKQSQELKETLAHRQKELSAVEENLLAVEEERKGQAAVLEKKEKLLQDARARADELRERFSRMCVERDALERERELLHSLRKEMEGFGEGVRSLFREHPRPDGIEAVAAEIFSTEERFERAVEAALGLRLQSVVTRDTGSMLNALEKLRTSRAGSATFISRDLVNGYREEAPRIEDRDTVLAYCSEVVTCGKEYEFLRKLLFSDIAIVEDLRTAIDLQKKTEAPLHLVTLAGETLCRYAVSGGTDREDQASGAAILERRRKIEEIEGEIRKQASRIDTLENERQSSAALCESLEKEKKEAGEKLGSVDKRINGLRADITRLSLNAESLLSRHMAAVNDASRAASRSVELAGERDEMLETGGEAREALECVESQINESRSLVSAAEQEARQADAALQEVSLKLAEMRARLSEVEKSHSIMKRESDNVSEEAEKLGKEIEERKATLVALDRREKEIRACLDESFGKRAGLLQEKSRFESELDGLRQRLEVIDASLNGHRKKKEAANEARHELELELERVSARRELLVHQVADNYDTDLVALDEDFPFFPTEEEAQKGEHASRELLDTLQARVRSLGPVNVLAIEEYDTEKERLDFLLQQRDDLDKARESLMRLIDEINKTARERFLGTFAKVQDNFQDIFSSLFEGGQAHITLVEENNPLESPIEVIARPRGKKMLGLSLLSGGEKALTALALLLAIYSVKPSPFCILDEVDAPLDDANIDRFLSIVHRFSRNTQFVIVTHNKRTMEAADCLYGVTMQDAGVSRVVSVRLGQVDEDGSIKEEGPEEEEMKAG